MSNDLELFMSGVAEYDTYADDVDLAFTPKEIGAGEFTCLFTKFAMSVATTKDGVDVNVAKATFEIITGEKEGDTFVDTFWFAPNPTKAEMTQRRLLILARTVAGRTIRQVGDAAQILEDAAGDATLNISIESSTSKKKPDVVYFNVNYKSRIDMGVVS